MYIGHLALWKFSEGYRSFLVDVDMKVLRSFQQVQDLLTYIRTYTHFLKLGLKETRAAVLLSKHMK